MALRYWILIVFALGLSGCAPGFSSGSPNSTSNSSQGDQTPPATPGDPGGTPPTTPPTNPVPAPSLDICSKLDFGDVVWPAKLLTVERKAMALALNITGSFEGSAGWANLGNNFDGQGMSLGLNQQNLGQGSLQPMLTAMMTENRSVMAGVFSANNLKSLSTMLSNYSGQNISSASAVREFANEPTLSIETLFPEKSALSPLDEDYVGELKAMDAKTDASVAWARANLYQSGGAFKADWRVSFQTLAVKAPYRTLQIEAAMTMFTKAQGYFVSLKFTEMRSLLMMYDIVVQNGGLNSTHLSQYAAYVSANPNASETARLNKLLTIRLVSVRDQYKADVSSRKSAIINGTGTVHGAKRNLPNEYCYKSSEALTRTSLSTTYDLVLPILE